MKQNEPDYILNSPENKKILANVKLLILQKIVIKQHRL